MKRVNNWLTYLVVLVDIVYLVGYIASKDLVKILECIALVVLMFLPKIVEKKFKLNEYMRFVYIVYTTCLLLVGVIMNLYDTLYYYDSITHFITGIAGAVFGLLLLDSFNMYNPKKTLFNVVFMVAIVLSIAGIWEMFEFTNSKIFNIDVQRVLLTGVNDTMKDIILAFLGSLLTSIWYSYIAKYNKGFIDKILK